MAKNKEIKTNAMRILDRMKIPYSHYTYACDEFVDGICFPFPTKKCIKRW